MYVFLKFFKNYFSKRRKISTKNAKSLLSYTILLIYPDFFGIIFRLVTHLKAFREGDGMKNKKELNTPIDFVADTLDKGVYDIYDYKRGGLANGRDLGGMKTKDGKTVKHNRLIRSGKLCKLNKKEVEKLRKANVKTVVDLRMENESTAQPDTKVDGIKYHHIPVLCATLPGITRDKSMYRVMKEESALLKKVYKDADDYMMNLYDLIVFSPDTKKQLKRSLEIIINSKGCVLWHCAAGKDRAGIVAMLIEGLLGVSDEDIIKDYVASQNSLKLKKTVQKVALTICTLFTFGYRFKRILFAMLDAKAEYIKHVLQGINDKFGSIENYCTEALKISQESIDNFKANTLV